MSITPHPRFTGKHMAAILIGGFAVVATVNFYMASLATGGFHGVVVENSYVASQHFNEWLAEAETERALGWQAKADRDRAGFVTVTTQGVPAGAEITAELRRPLGAHQFAELTFEPLGDGRYRATLPVEAGRWTMRLHIVADGHRWAAESELAQ